MRRAGGTIALLVALAVAAALPAAAGAATRHWRMTATLTGSYAVSATAQAACAASFSERVTGVRVVAGGTLFYDTAVHVLAGDLRLRVRGGRWRLTGSFNADADASDGTPGCAAQPTPVDCGQRVVADDGLHVGSAMGVRLLADVPARGRAVSRIGAPRLVERYADAGRPPAGWPSICRVSTDDPSVVVSPLFGLSATGLAQQALGARLPVPAARLAGQRPFALRLPARRAGPACPAQGFEPCSQQGLMRLVVRFRPA